MVYEVKLCIPIKNDFKCIRSVLVPADGITQCREVANEIVQDHQEDTKFFIEEFIT